MPSAHFMRPFGADPASSSLPTKIHPALTSFADEVCATVARLFAYVGTLAFIAILAVHFWQQLPEIAMRAVAPHGAGSALTARSPPSSSAHWIPTKNQPLAPSFGTRKMVRKDILPELDGDNRSLAPLTAGNEESKLTEFFARGELNRRNGRAAGSAPAGDWITDPNNPPLRGPL